MTDDYGAGRVSAVRAERFMAAVRELHASCHDMAESADITAIAVSKCFLNEIKETTIGQCRPVPDWPGDYRDQGLVVLLARDILAQISISASQAARRATREGKSTT